MIKTENNQVFSAEDKYIRRKGTDIYFKRGTLLPADTARDFEGKVEELIRARYSVSQELAILRQRDTKPDEFAEYDAFAERCKAEARQTLAR